MTTREMESVKGEEIDVRRSWNKLIQKRQTRKNMLSECKQSEPKLKISFKLQNKTLRKAPIEYKGRN